MKPRDARTSDQICRLRTDNKHVPSGWILLEDDGVILANQRDMCGSTGQVSFSRKEFGRLIDWYNRDQKVTNDR